MVHLKGDFFGVRDNTHCNSLQCLLIISNAHLAAQLCANEGNGLFLGQQQAGHLPVRSASVQDFLEDSKVSYMSVF